MSAILLLTAQPTWGAAAARSKADQALSARAKWVVHEIYQHNHPYALQASDELADKMRKMALSPHNFLRGTNHLFFSDIRRLPALSKQPKGTELTWLCGDAHLGNLGARRDANGTMVFALSDFDDSYLGSYLWDLQRMGVSIVLAARENGLPEPRIASLVDSFSKAYFLQMAEFSEGTADKDQPLSPDSTSGVVRETLKEASTKQHEKWLAKYTRSGKNPRLFDDKPDLRRVKPTTVRAITAAMPAYIASLSAPKARPSSFYAIKDIRQKLGSGTGSLGRLRYWLLIEGNSAANDDDIILEMKQSATSSVPIAASNRLPAGDYGHNEAQRVAMSLVAQSFAPDPLAGYTQITDTPYFLREKSPYAEDFDFGQLGTPKKFLDAMSYVGQALASAHALADQSAALTILPRNIEQLISSAHGKTGPALTNAISRFALSYASQVETDWQSYKAALAAGSALY